MPLPRDVSTNPLVLAKTLKHLASFFRAKHAAPTRRQHQPARAREDAQAPRVVRLRAAGVREWFAREGLLDILPEGMAPIDLRLGDKRSTASDIDAMARRMPAAHTASDAGEEKVEVPAAQL